MEKKEPKTGDLIAFEINGELFVSRITKIEGYNREMSNTVNMNKGCLADLRGSLQFDGESRELTREENQRYHDFLMNQGEPLKHYKGEDYMPAGTCIKLGGFICLTTVDIIKEGKVDNMAAYGLYNLETKEFPSHATISGGQIEQPSDEETAEYWNAFFEASKKVA